MKKQNGQIVLILILVMTVALAIGISVIQRSLTDISTSTKIEESSRAFSAAEAGIEKALISNTTGSIVDFTENQSKAEVTGGYSIPAVVDTSRQAALEFPPLAKEQTAHVWLADPKSTTLPNCSNTDVCYTQLTLDVYWGDPNATDDRAALEVTLIYWDGTKYTFRKWYLDSIVRNPTNNFDLVTCTGSTGYYCKVILGSGGLNNHNGPLPSFGMMMLTARLLYNTKSQPFAVQATGTCGWYCSLPPQAKLFKSTGTSGQTQRSIKLFQVEKVVPYLDYALFSVGTINK